MEVGNQGLPGGGDGEIKGTKAKEGKRLRGEIKGAESAQVQLKILREKKVRRRKDDGEK